MWKPEEHTDEQNLRWAWLRAVEWREWPAYLSQPIIPILLYFYPWEWVIVSIAVSTFLWWLVVPSRTTPASGIDSAVYWFWLKGVTAPLMAYLMWQKDGQWMALAVLVSPFLVGWAVGFLLVIPQEVLSSVFPVLKASQIGVVQRWLMDSLGYEAVGYVRRERLS